jgi:hypothetical protein
VLGLTVIASTAHPGDWNLDPSQVARKAEGGGCVRTLNTAVHHAGCAGTTKHWREVSRTTAVNLPRYVGGSSGTGKPTRCPDMAGFSRNLEESMWRVWREFGC